VRKEVRSPGLESGVHAGGVGGIHAHNIGVVLKQAAVA
jgi:hypothetical protein